MKINYLFALALAVLSYGKLNAETKSREEVLKEEEQAVRENSLKIAAQFYTLEGGEDLKEITQAILQSPETRDHIKERILASGRRIFLFKYPKATAFKSKDTSVLFLIPLKIPCSFF